MVKKRKPQRSMLGDAGQMVYWPILMGGGPQEGMPQDTRHQDLPVEPPAGGEKPDAALMTRHPYNAAFGDRTPMSVNADGQRSSSEDGAFWLAFLRSLITRGVAGNPHRRWRCRGGGRLERPRRLRLG